MRSGRSVPLSSLRSSSLIVLTAIRWAKIVEGHSETVDHLETILQTLSQPDYREPDIAVGHERMFRRGGPERWMRVVIDLEQIITAFAQTNDPA